MWEKLLIVMPFMANGSLLAYLKKERPRFNIAEEAGSEMVAITGGTSELT